jgi:hypothetical protein
MTKSQQDGKRIIDAGVSVNNEFNSLHCEQSVVKGCKVAFPFGLSLTMPHLPHSIQGTCIALIKKSMDA